MAHLTPEALREIRNRITESLKAQGLTAAQLLRDADLTLALLCNLSKCRRVGERLLFHVCLRLHLSPRWVLTGVGSSELKTGDWPLGSAFPRDLRWMVRGAQKPSSAAPRMTIGPVGVLWEAPCFVCGGRVQGLARSRKGRTVVGVTPKWVCCDKPACIREIKRQKWDAMYTAKTQALGFAPCRCCLVDKPLPGKSRCQKCRDLERQNRINREEDKVVAGVCKQPGCKNPLKPGFGLCHMHHEIKLEHLLAQRGRLVQHMATMDPGRRKALVDKGYAARLLRCQVAGRCFMCQRPAWDPDAAYPLCERHRRIGSSKRRCRKLRKKHWTRISIRTLLLKVRLPVP